MGQAAALQRKMMDAVVARDFDTLRALYHPDYVYWSSDSDEEQKGAEAGVAVAQTYTSAFPDMTFDVVHSAEDGDVAIMEFVARGTHQAELEGIPATGRSVEVKVCNICEIADGQIVREREYWDSASLLKQLGVLEA